MATDQPGAGIGALKSLVPELCASADALASLGAAMQAQIAGAEIPVHVGDVLDALGMRDAIAGASAADLRPLLGQIRVYSASNAALLQAAPASPGWAHRDSELLCAAGDVSSGFAARLSTAIAPQLGDLSQRLGAPDARFLEVGTGTGVVALEMAALWPGLKITGIDPLAEALAIARGRVEAAGFDSRIELREARVEELTDLGRYDLAWLPGAFISASTIPEAVRRIHAALRPGGWLLLAMLKPGSDRLASALAKLRTAMFGGYIAAPTEAEVLLSAGGFKSVHVLPAPATSLTALVAGER